MKIVKNEEAQIFSNSSTCSVREYPLEDRDINGAIATITGRYPEKGLVTNSVCKELVYVISGQGKIAIGGKDVVLSQGDMLLIEPNETYYWEGEMTLMMPCTPAWYPEQHKEIA